MKPLFSCLFLVLISTACFAQGKVGIGTNTPSAPLDIVGQNNWDLINGEGDVRIGNPNYRLKIGVATGGGGAGAVSIMQFGVPNGYNVLTLGSQGKEVLHVNGTTGFTGIGTASPVSLLQVAGTTTSNQLFLNGNSGAPLVFSSFLGKKINLYTGVAGNVGFGVYGNELRMHSDYSGADITFGYENTAGTFTERMRVKGNGAIALNGNAGSPGQVLMSMGTGAPATWSNKPSMVYFNQSVTRSIIGAQTSVNIPGLDYQLFSVTQTSKVVFATALSIYTEWIDNPFFQAVTTIKNSNGVTVGFSDFRGKVIESNIRNIFFQGAVTLAPGVYTIYSVFNRPNPAEGTIHINQAMSSCSCQGGQIVVQIFPE